MVASGRGQSPVAAKPGLVMGSSDGVQNDALVGNPTVPLSN